MKKLISLTILSSLCAFSANAALFNETTVSDGVTAPLSHRVILDQGAKPEQKPDIVVKDGFSKEYNESITYKADMTVRNNVAPDISVNKFTEFGLDVENPKNILTAAELNIHNPTNAKLVIIEVTGNKSTAVSNTNLKMVDNKADVVFANKHGSTFHNFSTTGMSVVLSKQSSDDIIKARQGKKLSALKEANKLDSSNRQAVSLSNSAVTLSDKGILKAASY